MGAFSAMDVAATGMTAQQLRIDIISQNIANAHSTRGDGSEVYRRKTFLSHDNRLTSVHFRTISSGRVGLGNVL